MEKTLALCCELIRQPSVTPQDAGCQALLMQKLRALNFNCTVTEVRVATGEEMEHGHVHGAHGHHH